jgi:hypothetical protein
MAATEDVMAADDYEARDAGGMLAVQSTHTILFLHN